MAFDQADNYAKFHGYLNELLASYTKLGELLLQKLSAISKFDITALDSIIKEEQVFVLLSRGFDANIQSYREKLSLKGDSLSAVIKEIPAEYQPEFNQIFAKLKAKLDEVKALNEKCQGLIEERIYTLERSIHQLDKTVTPSYGKPGTAKPNSASDAHILHKSV